MKNGRPLRFTPKKILVNKPRPLGNKAHIHLGEPPAGATLARGRQGFMVQGEKVLEVHWGQLYLGKQIYIGNIFVL